MNHLVKILTSDKGEKYAKPKWHLVHIICGGRAALCTGEFFGDGESGCSYNAKKKERGGITCPDCLEIIKKIKSVKL